MAGREDYDDEIFAKDLKKGDEIHLTFMGGDDYLTIDEVKVKLREGKVFWKASAFWCPRDIEDECNANQKVWIKKKA